MTKTEYLIDDKEISYEISEDGYDIYLSENVWISQHGEYGKPIDKEKTYEENCLAQIENVMTAMTATEEPPVESQEIEVEPTTDDILAEMLLNQSEIMVKQSEHDDILAEIMLSQAEGMVQ